AHTAQAPQPIAFIEKSKFMFHVPYIHHKYNYFKLFFLIIKKYYGESHGKTVRVFRGSLQSVPNLSSCFRGC
ncbi:MAG: hypothetical protein LBP38_04660, partial [Desulfovibrio sp.]|nr:hypothetical protein [Desulfovibrio sp.]